MDLVSLFIGAACMVVCVGLGVVLVIGAGAMTGARFIVMSPRVASDLESAGFRPTSVAGAFEGAIGDVPVFVRSMPVSGSSDVGSLRVYVPVARSPGGGFYTRRDRAARRPGAPFAVLYVVDEGVAERLGERARGALTALARGGAAYVELVERPTATRWVGTWASSVPAVLATSVVASSEVVRDVTDAVSHLCVARDAIEAET